MTRRHPDSLLDWGLRLLLTLSAFVWATWALPWATALVVLLVFSFANVMLAERYRLCSRDRHLWQALGVLQAVLLARAMTILWR